MLNNMLRSAIIDAVQPMYYLLSQKTTDLPVGFDSIVRDNIAL